MLTALSNVCFVIGQYAVLIFGVMAVAGLLSWFTISTLDSVLKRMGYFWEFVMWCVERRHKRIEKKKA